MVPQKKEGNWFHAKREEFVTKDWGAGGREGRGMRWLGCSRTVPGRGPHRGKQDLRKGNPQNGKTVSRLCVVGCVWEETAKGGILKSGAIWALEPKREFRKWAWTAWVEKK